MKDSTQETVQASATSTVQIAIPNDGGEIIVKSGDSVSWTSTEYPDFVVTISPVMSTVVFQTATISVQAAGGQTGQLEVYGPAGGQCDCTYSNAGSAIGPQGGPPSNVIIIDPSRKHR